MLWHCVLVTGDKCCQRARLQVAFVMSLLQSACRDAREGTTSGKRKRRRGRLFHPRNLLVAFALLSCLGTLLYIYSRLAPKLP